MSGALDMSLDDLIKSNKKPSSASGGGGGGQKGRPRSSGPGPARRVAPSRAARRSAPYATSKAPDTAWQHDMYSDQAALYADRSARPSSIETGTKLYISNLDYGVSNEDIKELFSEVGDLKRYSIHYDRSGRSKGTAEVVFTRRVDALAAVEKYDNVQLDGKPMNIKIIERSAAQPRISNGGVANVDDVPKSVPERGVSSGGPRRGAGRSRRRGRGRGKGRSEPMSVEDLDADLDKYHSEAKQIN